MFSLGPELLITHVQAVKAQLIDALGVSDAAAGPLVLDCSALHQVDAAGLQLLVTLAMTLRERGSSLGLRGCPAALRRRIEGAALQAWFDFEVPEAA